MKLLILGGGVAGSVAASYAVKRGINQVLVLEREETLGGLHQDVVFDDLHFDIGAFFFWPYHKILATFPGLKEYMVLIQETNFLSLSEKGNLDFYPPTAKGYIRDWGIGSFVTDAAGLVTSRIKHQVFPTKFQSVDDEMKYFMGRFYEKMGLRKYIARLYGIEPSEISTEFSTKRLQFLKERLSNKQILQKLSMLKLSDLNRYATVETSYARPVDGFSRMYGYIEQELRNQNVDLQFNAKIDKILLSEKQVVMHDGTVHSYDALLSSIPLSVFCKLSNTPLSLTLKFKPLYSLFYEVASEPIPGCHVLFNFSQRGFWKRITFHSSYYGSSNGKSYFVLESMPEDSQVGDSNTVASLDQDFRNSFDHTDFSIHIQSAKLLGSKIIPNAYPIYTKDFDPSVIDSLKQQLVSDSAYIVGRQGEFDYISSSDVANSSIRSIDEILSDTSKAK